MSHIQTQTSVCLMFWLLTSHLTVFNVNFVCVSDGVWSSSFTQLCMAYASVKHSHTLHCLWQSIDGHLEENSTFWYVFHCPVSSVYHLSRNYLIMNYSFHFTVLSPREWNILHQTLYWLPVCYRIEFKKITASLNGLALKYTADMFAQYDTARPYDPLELTCLLFQEWQQRLVRLHLVTVGHTLPEDLRCAQTLTACRSRFKTLSAAF